MPLKGQKDSSFGGTEDISSSEQRPGKLNSYSDVDLPEYDPVLNVTETTEKTSQNLETIPCGRFSLKKSTFSNVIKKFHFTTYRNINETQKLKNAECTSLKSRDVEFNPQNDATEDFPTYDSIESTDENSRAVSVVDDFHTQCELSVYDALQMAKNDSSDFEHRNRSHVADDGENMPIYDTLQGALTEKILEETFPTKDTCDSCIENDLPVYDVLQYCTHNGENETAPSNHCAQELEPPIYDDVIHDAEGAKLPHVQEKVQMEDSPPDLKTKPPNLLKNRLVSAQKKPNNIRNALQSPTSFLYRSVRK